MKFTLMVFALAMSGCYTKAQVRLTSVPSERVVICPMGDSSNYQAHDVITRVMCLQAAIDACGDHQVLITDDTASVLKFKCR